MIIAGLTGSIAMGKSEVSRLLQAHGIPVHDADATVHRIYEKPETASLLAQDFPEAIVNGRVSRTELSRLITVDPSRLPHLEQIVHPLVREAERSFLANARTAGAWLAVLDIPLLFETGRHSQCDTTIVVSAPEDLQHGRAMQRPGMTAEKLATILARQMPDAEKRARADHVLNNDGSLADLAAKVDMLLAELKSGNLKPRKNRRPA